MATLEIRGPAGHDLVMLDEARLRFSIGKSEGNDLVLANDPAVSRLHARLEREGPAWCITDLGSTNGTTVEGERLFGPRALGNGAEILIGRTHLVLHDRGASGELTTEPLRRAPRRTPKEQEVLVELCRPLFSGRSFATATSRKEIATAIFTGESNVQMHLGNLYDKFGIDPRAGESRRVLLANEAILTGAVTKRDYLG